MNAFYAKLKETLEQGNEVVLATAVDQLVEFSDSYDVLISQKAFLCQDELTAETPSMRPFWEPLFTAVPDQLPDVFFQDTWWAFFDALETPFPAGVLDKLAAGETLVLATAITKAGSNADFAAAKMAVDKSGAVYGSFGNPEMDAKILETAKSVLDEYVPRLLEYPVEGSTLRILLDPIN